MRRVPGRTASAALWLAVFAGPALAAGEPSLATSLDGTAATDSPGSSLELGTDALWRQVVSNAGDAPLVDLAVVHRSTGAGGGAVDVTLCELGNVAAGESAECARTIAVRAGERRFATVLTSAGTEIAAATAYYGGVEGAGLRLSIDTAVEGDDADVAPGPSFDPGTELTLTYTVTNDGQATPATVFVRDALTTDAGTVPITVCAMHRLQPGESRSCERTLVTGTATYVGRSTAEVPAYGYAVADDTHFVGGTSLADAIDLELFVAGVDADTAPGPSFAEGDQVDLIYTVANTGETPLANAVVTSTRISPTAADPVTVCVIDALEPGQSVRCLPRRQALLGQYEELARVIAQGPSGPVQDEDAGFYTGGPVLTAIARAVPRSGAAPLTVTFSPSGTSDTAIERYEWDFDGDGTVDTVDTVGRNVTFRYRIAGSFVATLTVIDTRGERATDTVTINVGNDGPVVTASATPSNGAVPLTVNFRASATDPDGIASYGWDFDGDGTVDVDDQGSRVQFVYRDEGTFSPSVTVTDRGGAATVLQVPSIEVRAGPPGTPTVTASARPSSGSVPLTVSLDVSVGNLNGATVTRWEWDFDGDGTFDSSSTTDGAETHTYDVGGTFYPRVRVTTSTGATGEDVVEVRAAASFELAVSTDTIDLGLSETVTVSTTLDGPSDVGVVIEDTAGNVVRTLVATTRRAAGSYDDVWDGTGDDGMPVADGQYRAILLSGGGAERLDLSLTTGGRQYNPSRSRIPRQFFPYADEPLVIDYTLPAAAEVTAFMGRFNVNSRLITFFQRDPQGAGTRSITWHGTNSDGQLIHPPQNDSFLFGIFAFSLPDNAIVVRNRLEIADVGAEPAIFLPTDAEARSEIGFTSSKAGTAEIRINDAETGTNVRTERVGGVAAGSNRWEWDGRNDAGDFVAAGTYRIGVSGSDGRGDRSMTQYTLQRVYY